MPDKKKPPVGAEGQESACETERVMREAKHTAASPAKVKPDTAAAVAFLRRFHPSTSWVLTAIAPNGATTTATFTSAEGDKAAAWIEARQGRANLYHHVNPVRRPLTSKARKDDIARLAWLHVDCDPEAGKPIDAERERILKALQAFEPRPTVIVDSGGGFQGFWRLQPDSRLEIDGNIVKAEELEAYNIQLEQVLGADHTHNVDRLMRLPGTVNVPNAKKRAKGRVPTLARLVTFDEDATYSLDVFQRANVRTPAHAVSVELGDATGWVPGDVEPCGTDALADWAKAHGKAVADATLARIATGTDPVDPTKYGSRSEVLFRVCCDLVRAGVDAAVIFRVITDRDNKIAESVLDKPDWKDYALRQIGRAKTDVAEGPPVVNPKEPLKAARLFVERKQPHLLRYNEDWLAYSGTAYAELEDATLRREVYCFLEHAKLPRTQKEQEAGAPFGQDFQPNATAVNNVLDALRAVTHCRRDSFKPPCWLETEGPDANELMACRNGLLYLPTGELHAHTPKFFTRNALSFDYDPAAPVPTHWLAFLDSVWPEDAEAKALLQEMFGYVLIPDTSQQKIFLMVGPTRSGKGTIARVMTELVGQPNVCAPTLMSFGSNFPLEPLLGKQVAILSDVRLDRKANHAAIAETLLRVSGEDLVTVGRKFKGSWDGQLQTRIVILSNLMPRFSDASPALANRFVPLLMDQSFLGREDTDLLNKLLQDLPGILNWAIEGWRRLRARGHFELPRASKEAIQQLIELAAPVATFIGEACELDPEGEVPKMELFERWRKWCEDNGSLPGSLNTFSSQLYAATSALVRSKKSRRDGGRLTVFAGLRLKQQSPY